MILDNKTLAYAVLVVVAISVFGTAVAVVQFNKLTQPKGFLVTGNAPHDYTGNVTINITETLSITILSLPPIDNLINFSNCRAVGPITVINSENTSNTSAACADFGAQGPDHIYILNDGNVDANVTVNVTNYGPAHAGGTFLTSPINSTDVEYKGTNVDGDCAGLVNTYQSFTSLNEHALCDNLTYRLGDAQIQFDVQITFPSDIPSQEAIFQVIFWGTKAT